VTLIADPGDATNVLVAPYCTTCNALPLMYLAAEELRMLRKVWPAAGWSFNRPPTRSTRPRRR
jgi:hypothetical protein